MLEFLQNFPPQLATLLLAVVPITEIRASIPIALEIYHLSIFSAVFWSVIGNAATAAIILWLLGPISKFLRQRMNIFDRFFIWLFARTRRKFYQKHQKYGNLALILFVAIPLPGTGCWTGSLAAWLFGAPLKKAFLMVTIGILISAFIVTLVTLGVIGFIKIV